MTFHAPFRSARLVTGCLLLLGIVTLSQAQDDKAGPVLRDLAAQGIALVAPAELRTLLSDAQITFDGQAWQTAPSGKAQVLRRTSPAQAVPIVWEPTGQRGLWVVNESGLLCLEAAASAGATKRTACTLIHKTREGKYYNSPSTQPTATVGEVVLVKE
jgi:hypothetical protein